MHRIFILMDQDEEKVSLSSLRGKKVLLSWHPLAWTPVCTDQVRGLDTNWSLFQSLNTIPFSISVDPAPSKKAWSEALQLENIRLLCDFWPHGKVSTDYGIFDIENGFSGRANYIVDENGIITWMKIYNIEQLPDINEVIAALSKKQPG